MVKLPEPGMFRHFDRPLRVFVEPAPFGTNRRFSIGKYCHTDSFFVETFGEMSHKQFSSPIVGWWDCDEGGHDKRDFQQLSPAEVYRLRAHKMKRDETWLDTIPESHV